MLDLKEVAKNFEAVVARLKSRGGTLDLSRFQELFAERSRLYKELEKNQAEMNTASEQMKDAAKRTPALQAQMKELGAVIKDHRLPIWLR